MPSLKETGRAPVSHIYQLLARRELTVPTSNLLDGPAFARDSCSHGRTARKKTGDHYGPPFGLRNEGGSITAIDHDGHGSAKRRFDGYVDSDWTRPHEGLDGRQFIADVHAHAAREIGAPGLPCDHDLINAVLHVFNVRPPKVPN